ncbi:hypothetical protein NP233_g10321 [Leucocoprinus birnbaumii]|uniref:Eukaryotic peptide chain release factor GTP-binding subunit n=1 Tax=Leucocoprinus birnbaumii TaxID=56174 RepID=A0AAD5VIV7_9AGAR|nr:hypothetical protein NP233_g10321 [Leucocoprinus birnbaumii]
MSKNAADQTILEDLYGDLKEHLNIVFIGHVDAGKSTMGGNILFMTGMVDKRTMEKYEKEAKDAGRESWYLSWALDSTPQERSKGKTVEVGRAYFETDARRYTILDAPGHKTYVPSMISGAAQADVAVLVISARKGEFETGFERGGQTREHIMLVKTAGVSKVVVVINKMDDPTVEWEEARYNEIKDKLTPFIKAAGYNPKTDVSFLPVSAYTGANLKEPVSKSVCPWWNGPSVLQFLDKMPMVDRKLLAPLMMPISEKYKDMGTIVVGKIESGHIRKGDSLLLMPNRDSVEVTALYNEMEEEVDRGLCGDNVRLRLRGVDDEDITPGFVLTSPSKPVRAVRQFEAQLAILEHKSIICAGYSAVLHVHTLSEEVVLSALLHYFDKATGRKSKKPPQFAKRGQKIVALIETTAPICIEKFSDYPQLGRFTLRDEGRTIAIGKVTKLIENSTIDEAAEGLLPFMSRVSDKPLDKASATKELAIALGDGLKLIQTDPELSKQNHDLKSILKSRLSQYYASRDEEWREDTIITQADAELLTACEALGVVERIQKLLGIEDDDIVPVIGTRDLGQIRTILSLVFKWGTEPLLNRAQGIWPIKSPTPVASSSSSKIMDLSNMTKDYSLLSELTLRVLGLLLPNGVHGKLPQSLITTTMLRQHLVDILRPSLALGWLPKSLSTEEMPVIDSIRPLVMRLLSILPTAQTISSLGSIISSSPTLPVHTYRACTALLSRQILRSDGVLGLFSAVFGEEETVGGDIAVQKLEHVSTVLDAVPANTKPQVYFEHVIPRVIALLSEKSSPTYRRAAAFTISRMLRAGDNPVSHSVKRSIIFGLLHDPLKNVREELDGHDLQQLERLPPGTQIHLRPDVAIEMLLALLSNADPSPSFISDLLSPVVPSLYSLLYHSNKVKTSDPLLKEALRGALKTWGKIVSGNEGVEVLWSIVRSGQQGGWKINLEGHILLLPKTERPSALSILTPDKVPDEVELDDPDFDANIFDLYPDPLHFVQLLKDMDRGDISSDLFVRSLEAFRGEKTRPDGDSLRILLYLQIIMQMQKQLSVGSTSNILKKPQQMLLFIYHVLESASSVTPEPQQAGRSKPDEVFRIVPSAPETEDEEAYEGDSDDDMPDSEAIRPDDELIETAINLLLSVMEADEDLSARTMPILNDIFSLLEPLSKDGSSSIRPLAREARLVMTARLASVSHPGNTKTRYDEEESAQEIYQKALKLLQDPILPVRAHGLLLLRQLVTTHQVAGKEKGVQSLDPALVPGILSIFLQSVQDDDSYIFLNSVQGLAAMVDGLGSEILKRLIEDYTGNLEGLAATVVNKQEVDVRTRIGEALGIVIKRCGEALGLYVDLLIPPLFKVVRAREIPTTLRTSAISLLADCVNTYSLAVLAYAEDLTGAMIDLLQVENVPMKQQATGTSNEENVKTVEIPSVDEDPAETMDNAPTSKNSKLPPLRRAALHFLGLLVKEVTRHTYESDSSAAMMLPQATIQRARVILGYISATDVDNVARVMAREVREGLEDFQKAKLGL